MSTPYTILAVGFEDVQAVASTIEETAKTVRVFMATEGVISIKVFGYADMMLHIVRSSDTSDWVYAATGEPVGPARLYPL